MRTIEDKTDSISLEDLVLKPPKPVEPREDTFRRAITKQNKVIATAISKGHFFCEWIFHNEPWCREFEDEAKVMFEAKGYSVGTYCGLSDTIQWGKPDRS